MKSLHSGKGLSQECIKELKRANTGGCAGINPSNTNGQKTVGNGQPGKELNRPFYIYVTLA